MKCSKENFEGLLIRFQLKCFIRSLWIQSIHRNPLISLGHLGTHKKRHVNNFPKTLKHIKTKNKVSIFFLLSIKEKYDFPLSALSSVFTAGPEKMGATEFNIARASNTGLTYKKVVSTLIYQEVYIFYMCTHRRGRLMGSCVSRCVFGWCLG